MEVKKIKLLIADDHKMFVEGLKSILTNENTIETIDAVFNGKQAIERCNKGDIDIVIMDINMPLIDGVYACAEIKKHRPNTKVIFVTMLTDLTTITNSLKVGADGYVMKGSDSKEILSAIKAISKGEIFISEQLKHFFSDDVLDLAKNQKEYIRFSQNIISQREKEILKLIADGLTNEKIAEVLSISPRTVDTHRSNMLTKLNLSNTAALVRFAMTNKLID
jgi:DNA-binding NarL/FixJ family response regulator